MILACVREFSGENIIENLNRTKRISEKKVLIESRNVTKEVLYIHLCRNCKKYNVLIAAEYTKECKYYKIDKRNVTSVPHPSIFIQKVSKNLLKDGWDILIS